MTDDSKMYLWQAQDKYYFIGKEIGLNYSEDDQRNRKQTSFLTRFDVYMRC